MVMTSFGVNKMKRLSLIVALLSSLGWGNTYSTNFPLTENPISDSGKWINGQTVGIDWTNVRTTTGFAFGTMIGTDPAPAQYADATAVLTGNWGADQTVQGTVKLLSGSSAPNVFEEVELRLRTTIAAHSITGYEVNCSVSTTNQYIQIVRWNGPLASWTQLNGVTGHCVNGDVLKATISGTTSTTITVYLNGNVVLTATDSGSPFTTGNPGMGFFLQGTSGLDANYGFSSFSATDGNSSTAPAPPSNLTAIVN
jgi:hypothetical protein